MGGQVQNDSGAAGREISLAGKIALLTATALALLGTPLVSPAMPEIAQTFAPQLDTDPVARLILSIFGWENNPEGVRSIARFILLSVPALFIVLGAPMVGWLSDRLGRRKLLIWSLVLFGVAGTSGFFAQTWTGMFIGRALLGVSIAGIKSLTVAMVGDYFEGDERAKFIGWQGSAMKFGGVVFLLLGGFLAEYSWGAPFWGYLLAFVALPGVVYCLYESAPQAVSGAASKAPSAHAMPTGTTVLILLSAFLASVLFFLTLVQSPFYVREALNGTPSMRGIAVAIANLAGAATAVFFYRIKARLGYLDIFAIIFATIALGYWIVVLMPSYEWLLVGMVVAGCGFGLIVPAQSAWMISTVPAARRGYAIGLVTTAMFLGQFAAAPLFATPFSVEGDPVAPFRAAAIALMALSVIYFFVSRVKPTN